MAWLLRSSFVLQVRCGRDIPVERKMELEHRNISTVAGPSVARGCGLRVAGVTRVPYDLTKDPDLLPNGSGTDFKMNVEQKTDRLFARFRFMTMPLARDYSSRVRMFGR